MSKEYDRFRLDGHKLLWHLDRVHAWQQGELVAPLYLEISPTSRCNHRCIFCGKDFARNQTSQLDTSIICQRLSEMGKLGVRSIMFAGEGEPLLHPDLARIVETTKQSGIDVAITTNGSLGNADLWRTILPNLSWIRFSVDAGTAQSYAAVHGVSPTVFDQTIASITAALAVKQELKLPVTIGVQFLILEQNIDEIPQAIQLFAAVGVDYLSLKPYSLHPQMRAKMDVNYALDSADRIQTLVEAQEAGKMQVIFRKASLTKYAKKERRYSHCRALQFWGYISGDGSFHTCSMFIGDPRFRVGNIYTQNMKEIFFGIERARCIAFAQSELSMEGECRVNCRMARINEFLEFAADKPEHINFI